MATFGKTARIFLAGTLAFVLLLGSIACAAPTQAPTAAPPPPTKTTPPPTPLPAAPPTSTPAPAAAPTKPAAVAAPTAPAAATQVAVKPITMRYSTYLPANQAQEAFTKKWMDTVTERSGGAIKFETHYAEALLKATETMAGTGKGIADVSRAVPGYTPSSFPLSSAFELVFITDKNDVQTRAAAELYQTFEPLREEFKKNNLHLLAFMGTEPTIIGSRQPIKTLDDLKGKKVRAYGLVNRAMQLVGAAPVSLPAPDIYQALERGTINAYSGFQLNGIRPFKLDEVTKYVVDAGMGVFTVSGIVINLNTWGQLAPNLQQLMAKTYEELLLTEYMVGVNSANQEQVDLLVKAGIEMSYLPQAEMEKARKIAAEVMFEEWIKEKEGQGLPGRKLLQEYQRLVAKYYPEGRYINPIDMIKKR